MNQAGHKQKNSHVNIKIAARRLACLCSCSCPPEESAVGTYQQWCLLALPVTTLLRQQSSLLLNCLLPWLLCLDLCLKEVKDRDQKDGSVGRALPCNLMNGV